MPRKLGYQTSMLSEMIQVQNLKFIVVEIYAFSLMS